MKISIRTCILGVLLVLLLGVSIIIIRVNYYTLNAILLETAKQSLNHISGRISENVIRYFQPLIRRAYLGMSMIKNHKVTPGDSTKFIDFLSGLIAYEPEIAAVYWADNSGNYFMLKKISNNQLFSESLMPQIDGGEITEKTYDNNMNLLTTNKSIRANFDPRSTPWFKQALFERKHSWYVSPLQRSKNNYELGITSIYPAFTHNGKLIGVLALDMPLTTVASFINDIKITNNSVIFICDEEEHLLSAYSEAKSLIEGYQLPTLADLHKPWIEESFKIFHKKNETVFIFDYAQIKYLAAYRVIPTPDNKHDWHVAVITPIQDIVAPLRKIVMLSLLFVVAAILLGILISTYVASRISKPIKKLAQDAELICQLELAQVKKLFSHIKEIGQMGDAFSKMRNALTSFQRYVPNRLVKSLVASGEIAEVGGETRELTIMFTDIENFSPLAEFMSPEHLMSYLSEYFQVITKIILNYNGTVDKYIGDGIMAFWGAPLEDKDHALHACQAAIAINRELKQLNSKWHNESQPQVATRIGINTGEVIVGNVGSDDRLSYTSMGDGVNVANRLETLNKLYGTYTMISASTYEQVKNKFLLRLLDKVAVKGKHNATYVYELLDEIQAPVDPKLAKYNEDFAAAFSCYEHGAWHKALELFLQLENNYPKDKIAKIFIARCNKFILNPPEKWDGTWVLHHV